MVQKDSNLVICEVYEFIFGHWILVNSQKTRFLD